MPTLRQSLSQLTIDQLKKFKQLFPDVALVGRKDELVETIWSQYQGLGLGNLWRRLSDLDKAAVAETIFDKYAYFNHRKFVAKYGKNVSLTVEEGRYELLAPLSLFLFYNEGFYCVPDDLHEPLNAFVSAPEPARLMTEKELPEARDNFLLVVRNMENEALSDLPRLLRLIKQGKIKVSDKTRQPGAATIQFLASQLPDGDFYSEAPKKNAWDQEIGAIKAFAWPLLLQAGGLAQRQNSRLAWAVL